MTRKDIAGTPYLRVAWAVLALALILRLGLIAATPEFRPHLDSGHYDGIACQMKLEGSYSLRVPTERTATTCGKAFEGFNPASAFRPPGWPFALATTYVVTAPLTDHRWTAARVAQALVGTLAVGLIGLIGWQLLGAVGGLFALGIAAADSTLIAVGGSLLSEPLFVALVAGAVAAALAARESESAARWLVLSGVLIGGATLVRANGVLLVPVLGLLSGLRWRGIAIAGAVCLLALVPWTVRNAIRMDSFVPVATYFGTALSGTFNEEARNRTDHPGGWISPRNVAAFQDVHRSTLSEVDKQAELRRRALEHIAEHPGYVLEVGARNTLRILSLSDVSWHRSNAAAMSLPKSVGSVAAAGFWVLLALTLASLVLGPGRRLPLPFLAGALLMLGSACFLSGESRYRAPMVPFMAVAAAALPASKLTARSTL